ncbi:GrpB family protein [Planobispora rosea]|uniref:GrpB family protein n=1 Tax=Planobispora rosea TaxID=35762 RepID=UPI0009FE1307
MDHIDSTSITGLTAKPVINIRIAVRAPKPPNAYKTTGQHDRITVRASERPGQTRSALIFGRCPPCVDRTRSAPQVPQLAVTYMPNLV